MVVAYCYCVGQRGGDKCDIPLTDSSCFCMGVKISSKNVFKSSGLLALAFRCFLCFTLSSELFRRSSFDVMERWKEGHIICNQDWIAGPECQVIFSPEFIKVYNESTGNRLIRSWKDAVFIFQQKFPITPYLGALGRWVKSLSAKRKAQSHYQYYKYRALASQFSRWGGSTVGEL